MTGTGDQTVTSVEEGFIPVPKIPLFIFSSRLPCDIEEVYFVFGPCTLSFTASVELSAALSL